MPTLAAARNHRRNLRGLKEVGGTCSVKLPSNASADIFNLETTYLDFPDVSDTTAPIMFDDASCYITTQSTWGVNNRDVDNSIVNGKEILTKAITDLPIFDVDHTYVGNSKINGKEVLTSTITDQPTLTILQLTEKYPPVPYQRPRLPRCGEF